MTVVDTTVDDVVRALGSAEALVAGGDGVLKTPFGIERLQSASEIPFVERALTNNLIPGRDVGVRIGRLGLKLSCNFAKFGSECTITASK